MPKSDAELERDIVEALSQTQSVKESETKKERERRLTHAIRAARTLGLEAQRVRDALSAEWDGSEIVRMSDEAVSSADRLLHAISDLKAK